MEDKMETVQLWMRGSLHSLLVKTFGRGKISANVERILRTHLQNPQAEKKLRMQELQKEIRAFNSDFGEKGELIFPEKEAPPLPPEEKNEV